MSNEKMKQPRRHGKMMGGPPGMSVEKPKDFKGSIKKLFSYIGNYKIGILFVILFAIAGTIFTIVGPKILGRATTEIFSGITSKFTGGTGIDFDKVGRILLTVLTLYLVSAVFSFIQGYIMTGISQKVCFKLRREMSFKINRMPMKYFDGQTHGEVLSRITNDVDTLGMSLNQSVTTLITSVSTIIGILIMMLTISPLLTGITVLTLPLSSVLMMFTIKNHRNIFQNSRNI
jgi:ATP-binding cassette subfamily B protein